MMWMKIITSIEWNYKPESVEELMIHGEVIQILVLSIENNYELLEKGINHGVGKGEAIPLVLKPKGHIS